MAKFFVWSHEGNGLCLAWHLQKQKHKVRFYVDMDAYDENGKGMVELAKSPDPQRDEVVIFDDVGFARQGTLFRRRGLGAIGGNQLETWEMQRQLGTDIMEEYGIQVPETHVFTKIADAQKFLEREGGYWYFKPDGKDVSKRLTQGFDADFLIRFLTYAEPHLKGVPRFQLQKRIEGIEVSCCVWVNTQAVVAAEATIEEKKFGTGDTGPSTGCQANLVWSVPVNDPLVKATIGHFLGPLLESGYIGMADLNCIITPDNQVYGIEFTMRLGYDCTQARMMLFGIDYGEQLDAFARNNLWKFDRNENEYAMTLRLSTLPQPVYPIDNTDDFEQLPVDPLLLDDPQFFPDDIKLNKQGLPVVTGGAGFVGVLGTVGHDFDLMRDNLVRRAKEYKIPYPQYRIDPVSRADTAVDFLAEMGYAPRLLGPHPEEERARIVKPAPPTRGWPPWLKKKQGPSEDHVGGGGGGGTKDSGDAPRLT